jgi:hypothetical protein
LFINPPARVSLLGLQVLISLHLFTHNSTN